MTRPTELAPDGGVVRHCACGAKLPPYSGRGRRPSKCKRCQHIDRQNERRRYERWRYKNDPKFRKMKRASAKQQRKARKDTRTPDA